ncbi:FixH family protein [Pedobacter sp. SL55]|uniref:FixH family protein n=1 Tax=Pedobacter sp. SL55 TaxID=2995161 RepID=UPI00226E9BA0|nr:FixH family protein [Pedobacter sp. SL55]WAC39907.1 FixH family protein [Pedobacter sp. SL55]
MNWGTKLVLGMAVFMSFIIGMVVYMFKQHGNDALVEDNYYEKGINYNKEYDAKSNTLNDGATPEIKQSENQLIIQLKDAADYQLTLMRPSAKEKDVKSNGKTISDENLIIIETGNLDKGLWLLKLQWQFNGKDYLFTKDIKI